MAYKYLREYINALEAEGELQRIKKEVDWDMEVGAIIRRSYDLKAPAPFFEKIKGYPEGYRILGAPAATSKNLIVLCPYGPYPRHEARGNGCRDNGRV